MLKKILLLFFIICYNVMFCQITGTVKDVSNQTLPGVSVIIKNTYNGSSTNEKGFYSISATETGNFTLIFKSIGYKTLTKNIHVTKFPFEVNVVLSEESQDLSEMVITSKKEDPAYDVIRNAIAAKKTNQQKIQKFSANLYSKASTYLDTLPDKILLFNLKKEKKELNYDQSKYASLSENHSNLKYKYPNLYYEIITASNVSGNKDAIKRSKYTDEEANFYNNNIDNLENAISPLANSALKYYKYKLVNTFVDEHNQLINKIEVIKKSEVEPTFFGHIYIVENSWELYALDLTITGKSIKSPFLNTFNIKQQFQFNPQLNLWTKLSQHIVFKLEALGAKVVQTQIVIFSNYKINDEVDENAFTFTKNITLFDPKSNKKTDVYWENRRPIPLENLEKKDFVVKDSIRVAKTQVKDSLKKPVNHNKFSAFDILEGYNGYFKKSKFNLKYSGVLQNIRYNTVQGFNTRANLETNIYGFGKSGLTLGANASYGLSENKVRVNGYIQKYFNRSLDQNIKFSGGSDIVQYNTQTPINELVNSVASLAFRENFAKYYQIQFADVAFTSKLNSYLKGKIGLNYSNRTALQNHSNNNIFNLKKEFTSNNPLQLNNDALAFNQNSITKLQLQANLNFNTNTSKNNQFNAINATKFPIVQINYEHALQSSQPNYGFQKIETNIKYNLNLKQYGAIGSNLNLFSFINQKQDLLFIDYKHFNGNQTHIFDPTQPNSQFNLLPYYKFSTQKAAATAMFAYNDKGLIINKIPVLKHTQFNLIGNLNILSTREHKPYLEYAVGFDNIGFGPYRIFKAQYTFTNQNTHGIIFGINTPIF